MPEAGASRGGIACGEAQAASRHASKAGKIRLIGMIDLLGEPDSGVFSCAGGGLSRALSLGHVEIALHDLQAQTGDFGGMALAVGPPPGAEAEAG